MIENERYWQAVLERDPAFEGKFVYAVRSTGIFCRPTCPSRRPRKDQVLFFASPQEAEQAGFRACLRCRPKGSPINENHVALAEEVCRFIENHLDEKLTLQSLADRFHLSPFHLQRTFKSITSVTPRQYADEIRSRKLKTGLREKKTVTEAMYEAGYNSSGSLYGKGAVRLGMTPAAYQLGGKSMEIEYTIAPNPLGYVLVAATERGICAASLGSSEAELEDQLAKEYPRAVIHRNDNRLSRFVQPILQYLEGSPQPLDLPLDIQATTFQWKVWEALQAIPYGKTRTYSEVAAQLGHPRAARAVARACATNKAALVIPCHRVVGAGGKLSGYRWGINRKKVLLDMEKTIFNRLEPEKSAQA